MTDEVTVLIIDESVVDREKDILVQVIVVPFHEYFLPHERFPQLEEPVFAFIQELFNRAPTAKLGGVLLECCILVLSHII